MVFKTSIHKWTTNNVGQQIMQFKHVSMTMYFSISLQLSKKSSKCILYTIAYYNLQQKKGIIVKDTIIEKL